MLTRFSDWQTRLQGYLNSHRNSRFKYGEWDCCLFTCDCVFAMTGEDMAAWFRGKYTTRKRAMELIKERTGDVGISAIAEYAAAESGMKSIPVLMAQRGDMVLVGKGSKAVLGVVSLSGLDVMCFQNKVIVRVALDHVTAAWRV